MSDMCGNCSCTDKSQCVKKGNEYGVLRVHDGRGCPRMVASASVAAAALAPTATVTEHLQTAVQFMI
ncbi:Metallothionein-like protein 3A [Bienertia sinuspersici]